MTLCVCASHTHAAAMLPRGKFNKRLKTIVTRVSTHGPAAPQAGMDSRDAPAAGGTEG